MSIIMKKRALPIFIVLLLILTACNLPSQNNNAALSLEDQAGTLSAQTLAAVTRLPTETRIPANTPTPPLPTTTPVLNISPTPTTSQTPTPAPKLPSAPTLQKYNFFCTWNGVNNDLSININWDDKAVDEQGYKIYRNGAEIVSLSPNTSTYTDIYAVDTGINVNYAIEAYNQIGTSSQITFSVVCQ